MPLVYLLNISQIAFQYGTLESPLMAAATLLGTGQDISGGEVPHISADVVSAQRDLMELEVFANLTLAVQRPGRPILAMADGTLIRWMLQRIEVDRVKKDFIARYATQLARFRSHQIPICSFVRMPHSTEVVNLLRGLRGETKESQKDTVAGILDRSLYDPFLAPCQRSALFACDSHILSAYDTADPICFFYLRVVSKRGASEIARAEILRWVAAVPSLLDLVHAAVVSDCEKGDGYPMILAEAHQKAVVKAKDRMLFYRLLERRWPGAMRTLSAAASSSPSGARSVV